MVRPLRFEPRTCGKTLYEFDGHCWSVLSDARDPDLTVHGAIVVAGEPDTAALAEIIDLQDLGHETLVRFRILPGAVEDYEGSLARSRPSA